MFFLVVVFTQPSQPYRIYILTSPDDLPNPKVQVISGEFIRENPRKRLLIIGGTPI
jgi:hypothetical protein